MKYAFNDNGILRDVVQANPAQLFDHGYASQFIEVPDDAQNGWLWDGTNATPPPPPPAPNPVPQEITMRQARLVLLGAGLLSGVQTAIDGLPEPQRSAANIEWEFSNTLQRRNPFVLTLGPALGLSAEQIDALFIQGATL